MQKCLRCARPNKLGFLLLAQKTRLFVRLRREKSIPVGALQEWDKKKKTGGIKKNFLWCSSSFGEGGILRNNYLSWLQRSFRLFWSIIIASLISQHSLLYYHLVFIIIWWIKIVCFGKSGKNFMMLLGVKWKPLWSIEPRMRIAALQLEISESCLWGFWESSALDLCKVILWFLAHINNLLLVFFFFFFGISQA